MKVIARTENIDIATVYIAEGSRGRLVEFVESVQPPLSRDKKWVLILSTLYGCPGGCLFCDAGESYTGKLTAREILGQADYMIRRHYPDGAVPAEKFKVQFARMGDPAFNPAVLEVLEELPSRYAAPGLLPALSTIAPRGTEGFFRRLLEIKEKLYSGRFQLQFSIHSTDREKRDWLMPARKWDFPEIVDYGNRFFSPGERKITLNFALAENLPVEPEVLAAFFRPDRFLIKITPVNPTCRAERNGLRPLPLPGEMGERLISALEGLGYEVLLSIGEREENHIGSNCGQYITNYLSDEKGLESGYNYRLQRM
ncbi:MAG: radical SAM protein [Candidatus Krumholzibacteriota bacterium]|nr:radical SAM protein [Candidatus Krumholzibacteriota bacterium]